MAVIKDNAFASFRGKHGMSQKELAEELDVAQGCIGNYECGIRMPSLKIAWRLVKLARKKGDKINLEDVLPDPEPD